jgi:DnaJ-class molecular chaperone
MPSLQSAEKGNLYVKINVFIPDYSEEDLSTLEDFFASRKKQ